MKLCLQILLLGAWVLVGACRSAAPTAEPAQPAAVPASNEKEKEAAINAAIEAALHARRNDTRRTSDTHHPTADMTVKPFPKRGSEYLVSTWRSL